MCKTPAEGLHKRQQPGTENAHYQSDVLAFFGWGPMDRYRPEDDVPRPWWVVGVVDGFKRPSSTNNTKRVQASHGTKSIDGHAGASDSVWSCRCTTTFITLVGAPRLARVREYFLYNLDTHRQFKWTRSFLGFKVKDSLVSLFFTGEFKNYSDPEGIETMKCILDRALHGVFAFGVSVVRALSRKGQTALATLHYEIHDLVSLNCESFPLFPLD